MEETETPGKQKYGESKTTYDGNCTSRDLEALCRWIFVEQRIYCQLYLNSSMLADTDSNMQPYIWSKQAA